MANLGPGESQKRHIGELAIEIESLTIGTKVCAIVVYTGELASIKSKDVINTFFETQC